MEKSLFAPAPRQGRSTSTCPSNTGGPRTTGRASASTARGSSSSTWGERREDPAEYGDRRARDEEGEAGRRLWRGGLGAPGGAGKGD